MAELFGTPGADTINGGTGADVIWGGFGPKDTPADTGNDTLNGGGGDDVLLGQGGNDILRAGDPDAFTHDYLYGGAGDDILYAAYEGQTEFYGNAGNDTFHATGGEFGLFYDIVHYEDAPGGITVNLTISGPQNTRSAGFDTFVGSFQGLVGSTFDDVFTGDDRVGDHLGSFDNVFDGGGGNDTMFGRGGEDLLRGGAGDDFLDGGTGDLDHLRGGTGNDRLKGGGGADFLFGEEGDDILDGGPGATEFGEILDGGPGFDTVTYASADAGVTVRMDGFGVDQNGYQETGGGGLDKLVFIENLTGSQYDDVLIGHNGNNVLDGGPGDDDLWGLDGNDTFLGRGGNDRFQGGNGTDSASYVSSGNGVIANLTIGQATGAGTDSFVSIENLTGSAHSDTLIGNSRNNVLDGSSGADILNGAAGNDLMIGGTGDDLIFVDSAGDNVVESIDGGGSDRVFASVSYALGATSVEKLTTANNSGTEAINLTGNFLVNTIFGNAGANILDGGLGADTLVGLGGNDWFFVDNAADVVIEGSGEGAADRVLASTDYTLGAGIQVESLTTNNNGAIAPINLTGNELGNTIFGNAGSNAIKGLAGNDVLIGMGGIDGFVFNTALHGTNNVDRILDFETGIDQIILSSAIFPAIAPGTLAASAFVIGATAADADDRIIYDSATGALLYDPAGTEGGTAVQFATLAVGLALTNAEFLVL